MEEQMKLESVFTCKILSTMANKAMIRVEGANNHALMSVN